MRSARVEYIIDTIESIDTTQVFVMRVQTIPNQAESSKVRHLV
jgi:hypothetical protein